MARLAWVPADQGTRGVHMGAALPERRVQIMEVSARLFALHGVSATTVRDIGEAAGVLSGSLYHYFRSKDAIVSEVLAVFMDDIHARFSEVAAASTTPEETLRGLVHATLLTIEHHPHPTAIYQNDRQYLREHGLLETVDTKSREIRGFWLAAIDAGTADGTFRDDVPAEVFYRSLRDTLWATMHWPNRAQYSTADFGNLVATLFLGGFARG